MKPSWSELTQEEKQSFGNGCSIVPDFMFTASCRQHDFNYTRGGGIKDKIKADWDLCRLMFVDALYSRHPYFYIWFAPIYFIGLMIPPIPYIKFNFGRYRTKEEILKEDRENKI